MQEDKKKGAKKVNKDEDDAEDKMSYVCGLLGCDGMNPNIGIKDSFHFIWFLNLASAYRDMIVEKLYDKFNIKNHNMRSYYLMGCSVLLELLILTIRRKSLSLC